MKKNEVEDFFFINDPSYVFNATDILLVVGTEQNIIKFSQQQITVARQPLVEAFRNLFPKRR